MNKTDKSSGFYQPDTKEIALAICFVLEQAGGCLSHARVVELVGEQFQIPESQWQLPRWNASSHETVGAYFTGWSTTWLRNEGFVARNNSQTRGMCILTDHGRELGRWAMRIYAGENPVLPDWVEAFLEPVRTRIKNLLTGGKRRRPPDYEICRWVRYCYLLNWPEQGVALFSRVLADHVEESFYRQTERQARIMRGRLEEQPPRADAAPADAEMRKRIAEVRKLFRNSFPVGARIPVVGQDGHIEVQAYSRAGIAIAASRTGQKDVVPWNYAVLAYLVLLWKREVDCAIFDGHCDAVCSLLTEFSGATLVPQGRVVRFDGEPPAGDHQI